MVDVTSAPKCFMVKWAAINAVQSTVKIEKVKGIARPLGTRVSCYGGP